jgi:hypothetical protein
MKIAKVKKFCPVTHHARAKSKRKNSSYSFLTSELDAMSGQRHSPASPYTQGKDRRTGGWVGLSAGLDREAGEKILVNTAMNLSVPGYKRREIS